MASWCFSWISSILASNPRGTRSFRMWSLSALTLSFLEFTMTCMTPKAERNFSVLFCWSLGPGQGDVLRRVGTSSCLMSISHLSKSFDDVRIFSSPKNFLTWALLNQFCSSLSTNTSVSLMLNSSDLKAHAYVHNFSVSFFFHLLTYTTPNILMDARQWVRALLLFLLFGFYVFDSSYATQ